MKTQFPKELATHFQKNGNWIGDSDKCLSVTKGKGKNTTILIIQQNKHKTWQQFTQAKIVLPGLSEWLD